MTKNEKLKKEVARLRTYSRRRFKSKRLRKKQISTLGNAYLCLSRKHKCWISHASVTGDIPDAEWWMFCIETIASTIDLISRKDEIPRIN